MSFYHGDGSLLPGEALCSSLGPDGAADGFGGLYVDVECADVDAMHVVPEGQTLGDQARGDGLALDSCCLVGRLSTYLCVEVVPLWNKKD